MLQRYLSRLLKVRKGEWQIVLLLQLQLFLIIGVLLIAKPAGNALFLSRFGSGALPYMYILTALVAGGVSLAYSAALRYHSILKVNIWSTGLCLLVLLAFASSLQFTGAKDIVAIGLYLWVALYGVVAASQFWLVANLVFDIRQAKRLFGFVGAGGIAGGIVGGYVANIIAHSYGFQLLLYVASFLLLPGVLITIYIWKQYITGKVPKLARRRRKAELQTSPWNIIKKSRHLALLCSIVTLSVVVAKLVDYQFSAMALKRFANEEHLTAFFGFWFSTFNVIGLLIQLLITQRVVKYVGISGALLFLPVGLVVGAITMFIMPGLMAATFSRAVDGSFKQSLHRAGLEMLFLPLQQEVKERIKTYIDVFIDSVAGGLGGLLLLLLVDGLHFSTAWISVLVLVLSIGWLVCVLLVREEYLDAFRSQLSHLRPEKGRKSIKSKHKEVLNGFLKVLADKDGTAKEQQLLYVLDKTAENGGQEFEAPVIALLKHPSCKVRARALRNLTMGHNTAVVTKVRKLVNDPSLEVKNAAVGYLINHYPKRFTKLIDEHLHSPDSTIATATFATLVAESKRNDYILMKWDIPGFFVDKVAELEEMPETDHLEWTKSLLKASGIAVFPQAKAFLKKQLEAKNDAIRHEAITAAGNSLDEDWLLRLIDFLSEAPNRPHARAALVQYGLGLVELLPTYFRNNEIDIEDIRRLPSVLERIGGQQVVDLLFNMLSKYYPVDLEFRLEALKALNRIKKDFPDASMPTSQVFRQIMAEAKTYQIVIENQRTQLQLLDSSPSQLNRARKGFLSLLKQRQNNNLDRLFRLLGLRYKSEDIIPIFLALKSENPAERTSAVEFLDNLLDASLKRIVIPLVEDEVKPEFSTEFININELLDTQYQQFRRILRGNDLRLKLAAIHLMGHLKEERYERILQTYAGVDEIRISDIAKRSLEQQKAIDTVS